MAAFGKTIADAYRFEGDSIELGRGVHEGKVVPEAVVRAVLETTGQISFIRKTAS